MKGRIKENLKKNYKLTKQMFADEYHFQMAIF
jgi:hypothetical protein